MNRNIILAIIASFTLGLAPFSPEPHIIGKLRWIWGGGEGMKPADYFDLLMHGAPWLLLLYLIIKKLVVKNPLRDVLKKANVHYIDVRESSEVALGMIPGASHMPLSNFGSHIATIQKINGPKIVYCRSGIRSGRAVAKLKSAGIENVYNGGGYKKLKRTIR